MLETTEEPAVKGPIVDNMFSFIGGEKSIHLSKSWLNKGFIHSEGKDASLMELTKSHKHSIVKRLAKASDSLVPDQEKKDIIASLTGDDKSDLANMTKLFCESAMASDERKAELWNELISSKS